MNFWQMGESTKMSLLIIKTEKTGDNLRVEMTDIKERAKTMKKWRSKVRKVYKSLDELIAYDEIYGIVKRCGYESAEKLWNDNPVLCGSTDPKDFGLAQSEKIKGLVKVADLVDVPIAGKSADVRHYTKKGELLYDYHEDDNRLVVLKSVTIKKENNQKWLHLEWEQRRDVPHDCGYSGIRFDCKDLINNWYIKLL